MSQMSSGVQEESEERQQVFGGRSLRKRTLAPGALRCFLMGQSP